MAETLTNAFVSLGGTDLSSNIKSVTLPLSVEEIEAAAMGDAARGAIPGLKVFSLSVEFFQNFAAGEVDVTLFPLLGDAAGFAVVFRKDTAAKSATNPEYTFTGILTSYGLGGSVGDAHMAPVEIANLAGGTIARSV